MLYTVQCAYVTFLKKGKHVEFKAYCRIFKTVLFNKFSLTVGCLAPLLSKKNTKYKSTVNHPFPHPQKRTGRKFSLKDYQRPYRMIT